MADVKDSADVQDNEIMSWLSKIKELYGAKRAAKFTKDEPFLKAYLIKLREEINLNQQSLWKLKNPHRVGGTGIIFKASHANLPDQELVLKFNRPHISSDEITMVENERQILPSLDHPNIIQVLDVGEYNVDVKEGLRQLSFIIESFIPDAKTLREYVQLLSDYAQPPNTTLLDHSLQRLVQLLIQWVSALDYIHNEGYVYLDMKPDNVIVDKDDHLVVIDFGSAQKLDPDDENSIHIYYTEHYAHPWLREKAKDRTSTDRVRSAVKRKELFPALDYYAMGKSILELLNIVLMAHPHDFPQRPLFRSLHFLATRLLDGMNVEARDIRIFLERHKLAETCSGLERSDYQTIRYRNLKDVLRDLKKEHGSWDPEDVVPELGTYAKNVVRVIADMNTVLTPRLRSLIEHPLFARLKVVTQLGLIALVYPTANHSRFDHVLGAYTYTASYIKALFHDSQNPIFHNLVDEHDIKATLLAALLHDLGQYPLAHDMGEIHPKIFGHAKISIDLLSNETRDAKGRTLLDIIKDPKDGWGVDPEWLKQILGAHSGQLKLAEATVRDFKADMLSALIDGPIDADKADYIIRDSKECRVPYGKQLDIERLLRVLTFARIPGARTSHRVTIGVYEKGRASADSLNLARYLLFSSVYWHHTSRILKSMLHYAVALILPADVFGPTADVKVTEIRERLLSFIVELIPPFHEIEKELQPIRPSKETKQPITTPPPQDVFEDLVKSKKDVVSMGRPPVSWYPGISLCDLFMINWLKKLGQPSSNTSRGIALLELIQNRRLYKRAYTIQRSDENRNLTMTLDELKWPDRIRLCEKIQENVFQFIRIREPNLDTKPLTGFDELQRLFANKLVFLVDIPNPKKMIGLERPLVCVQELETKTYYDEDVSPVKADNLTESLAQLMDSIAPIRILCHEKIRQWVRSCIPSSKMREIVENSLKWVLS